MTEKTKPRMCKGVYGQKHDMDLAGTAANGRCLSCEKIRDAKRQKGKRERRKFGAEVERFPVGMDFVWDSKGFRWSATAIETQGRLRAVCEHAIRAGTPHSFLMSWTLDYLAAFGIAAYADNILTQGAAPGYALREDVRLLRDTQDAPYWLSEDNAVRVESNEVDDFDWYQDTETGEVLVSYKVVGAEA